jgi:hypothetical protein
MTATFSNATAAAMLNVLGASAVYVSLHSADPGTTGASELTGNGYARQAITFPTTATQAIHNSALITFGPASADWMAATYYGLWSAVSAGTFRAGAALDATETVLNTETLTFASSALVLSLVAL